MNIVLRRLALYVPFRTVKTLAILKREGETLKIFKRPYRIVH